MYKADPIAQADMDSDFQIQLLKEFPDLVTRINACYATALAKHISNTKYV